MVSARVVFAALLGVRLTIAERISMCECRENWAACYGPGQHPMYGEEANKGCGNSNKTCVDICPGDKPWKPLYQVTVDAVNKIENRCRVDPTAYWGANKAPVSGPFALSFSGAIRNFVTTWWSWQVNMVEPSGGNVDIFFHVWKDDGRSGHADGPLSRLGRKLARGLKWTKNYYEENNSDYEMLAQMDEPGFGRYTKENKASWIQPMLEDYKNIPEGRPYHIGAGLSQWRKIWLTFMMIKKTGIAYSVVIRARPDHMFATRQPFDLRAFSKEFRARPLTKRARGHFLAVPERHHCEPYPDHFGMGSLESLMEAFARPLPYETASAESYMVKNLAMRCFYRNVQVMNEEFTGGDQGVWAVANHRYAPGTRRNLNGYSVIPDKMRTSQFSPLINCGSAVSTPGLGSDFCQGPKNRCIPAYRISHMYIYNTVASAFAARGSVCIGRYSNKEEADWLIWSGIANATDPVAAEKYGFGPCVRLPALSRPFKLFRKFYSKLKKADKRGLLQWGT